MPPKKSVQAAPPVKSGFWRSFRVVVLLLILAFVALKTWQDQYRSRRWNEPLYVSIYPIAADDSEVTRKYLSEVDAERFKTLDGFFTREAERFNLKISEPFKTRLRPPLLELPPQRSPEAGILGTVIWSLKLRFWAWKVSGHAGEPEDIRVFVLYHDPAVMATVPHSLGLEKGLIGVVYAFATPRMNGANNVVIAHELLHTLGATDKYKPATDEPLFPDGYGDPQQVPLLPQRSAEVMAGRRILAPGRFEQAEGLSEVVIGSATAREIHWLQHTKNN